MQTASSRDSAERKKRRLLNFMRFTFFLFGVSLL